MYSVHPKISICLPVYGVEKYIERCAVSLFEQTCTDVEYIFVDDCTKDHSIYILKELLNRYPSISNRVKIIEHQQNMGLAGARLTGLQHAQGDYVWFVDTDDYIEKDAIEKIKTAIDNSVDIISFSYIKEYGNTRVFNKVIDFNTRRILAHVVSPSIWKCIVKRSLYNDFNIYPVVGINHAEDLLLLARLVAITSNIVVYSDLYLYHYNCSNENSMMRNISTKSLENAIDASLLIYDFYKENGFLDKYRKDLNLFLAYKYIELSYRKLDYSGQKKIIEIIKQSDKCLFRIIDARIPSALKVKIFYLYRLFTNGRLSKL